MRKFFIKMLSYMILVLKKLILNILPNMCKNDKKANALSSKKIYDTYKTSYISQNTCHTHTHTAKDDTNDDEI